MSSPMRWRQARAIAILPGTVTVIVPAAILLAGPAAPRLGPVLRGASIATGVAAIVLGLGLMTATIRLLGGEGEGTLAPWDPTRRLVVRGVYRFVRNPMISGVIAVLFGEAALTASTGLCIWLLCFVAANAVYIPLVEERGLERRFGEAYVEYRRNVPRWVPRRTPWTPPDD